MKRVRTQEEYEAHRQKEREKQQNIYYPAALKGAELCRQKLAEARRNRSNSK